MVAVWKRGHRRDYLRDALSQLAGWTQDGDSLKRTLTLDDSQHAELTECITVAADALGVRPQIRRLDGYTQIKVGAGENGSLTLAQVGLAARVEALYQTFTAR